MSEVSICNGALTHVGASFITSFEDGTETADLCAEHYPTTRDALLARFPWGFATKRAQLAQNATAPLFNWLYAYELPNDYLRLIETNIDGAAYSIEGRAIVTDEAAPVKIAYVARIEDTGFFPEYFRELLEYVLADKLAFKLKQQISSVLIQKLSIGLETKEIEALSADSQQFPSPAYEESNLITARSV